ncbi:MAG: PorV/PorQ family protein [Salinibacter sp.]
MKSRRLLLAFAFLLLVPSLPKASGQAIGGGDQQKLAQTSMKFLAASVDPRAAALGNAVNTLEMGATSMFYNPAGMAGISGFGHFAASNMTWIANIDYTQTSVAVRPADGAYGTFGLSLRFVDYGNIQGTIRANNQQGYIETGTVSPSAFSIGIGYANALTDRISIGGTVKFAQQSLGKSVVSASGGSRTTKSNTYNTPAFDFGVRYETNFRGLTFAMNARNFSPAVRYEQNTFELPLMLSVGLSADVLRIANPGSELLENHSLLITTEGMTPRDLPEQGRIGGEYTFMDMFSLRGGYAFPFGRVSQRWSLGAGIDLSLSEDFSIGADYTFQAQNNFDGVNRVAVDISF